MRAFMSKAALFGLVACALQPLAMQGLLEKEIFWVKDNNLHTTKFWVLYLGDYEVTLNRKFLGEEERTVKATMNLHLYSSGYIKGTGYCEKGKLECLAALWVGDTTISLDEIDMISNGGLRAKMKNGSDTALVLDIEGTKMPIKKMELTTYSFAKDQFAETNLQPDEGSTMLIESLAFSRQAIDPKGEMKLIGGQKATSKKRK